MSAKGWIPALGLYPLETGDPLRSDHRVGVTIQRENSVDQPLALEVHGNQAASARLQQFTRVPGASPAT